MNADFFVERLEWDDWNRDHIAKHGVSPEEAEQVVRGNPVVRKSYKERLVLIGPSHSGRMLAVIVGPTRSHPHVYYVVSARPADRKERRDYEQEKVHNSTNR
jgi:uncharacterized protein